MGRIIIPANAPSSPVFEHGGKSYTLHPPESNYRYVAYDKQIQRIRNLDGFKDYHLKNPGSLKRILVNTIRCTLTREERLSQMERTNANWRYNRPAHYNGDWATGNLIPMAALMAYSINWLQGLIIEAYGAKGLDVIKDAKQEALNQLSI